MHHMPSNYRISDKPGLRLVALKWFVTDCVMPAGLDGNCILCDQYSWPPAQIECRFVRYAMQ